MEKYKTGLIALIISMLPIFAKNLKAENGDGVPIDVTATDLVSKVYGVLEPTLDKESLINEAGRIMLLVPVEDEGKLWLDSTAGYVLRYCGMQPEVSACAAYDEAGKKLSDYTYFFMFPYKMTDRKRVNEAQCEFCETLLKEMRAAGMNPGSNLLTEELFEVEGNYGNKNVNVRLLNDIQSLDSGEYLVIMQVVPLSGAEDS